MLNNQFFHNWLNLQERLHYLPKKWPNLEERQSQSRLWPLWHGRLPGDFGWTWRKASTRHRASSSASRRGKNAAHDRAVGGFRNTPALRKRQYGNGSEPEAWQAHFAVGLCRLVAHSSWPASDIQENYHYGEVAFISLATQSEPAAMLAGFLL